MSKKSLSDLLREEAQDPKISSPTPTVIAETIAETPPGEPTADQGKAAAEFSQLQTQLSQAQAEIDTLKAALHQEKSQVKKIAQLQTELETEKTLVGKLYGKIQDLESSLAAPPPPPSTLALRPPTMPVRYIAPHQPPSNLTDEDIGWFD